VCESDKTAGEETCVIPAYCTFLKNALSPFQCTLKELEEDNITALELYPLMETLIYKMSQSKEDMFTGEETEETLLKLDSKSSISIKKDFFTFYNKSLKYYLEKWFDFSDNYMYKIQFLSLQRNQYSLTSKKLL
jgi:hypothetical protein